MLLYFLLPLVVPFAHAFSVPEKQVKIQVGGNSTSPGGTTQFTPNLVLATNGTIVTFQFTGLPGNHSVTQSSFNNPCQPLAGGFDSGWVFVNESLPSPPEWNLTITNDQMPIWFHCKQLLKTPHCNLNMVGAINVETTNKSLPEFQSLAAAATTVPPGQSQGGLVGIGASATALPFIPSGATLFLNSALQTSGISPNSDDSGASSSSDPAPSSTTSSQSNPHNAAPEKRIGLGTSSLVLAAVFAITVDFI